MLRRENGVKYLDIDGASCVVHMCSTAENYFDRFAFDHNPSAELINSFIANAKFLGIQLPGEDYQECCFCGETNKITPLLPNNVLNFQCSDCNKEQSLYVIQLPTQLEYKLGLSGPTSGMGTSTIWVSVPSKHPQFHDLITCAEYCNGAKIIAFSDGGGAPWWPLYHKFWESINKLHL